MRKVLFLSTVVFILIFSGCDKDSEKTDINDSDQIENSDNTLLDNETNDDSIANDTNETQDNSGTVDNNEKPDDSSVDDNGTADKDETIDNSEAPDDDTTVTKEYIGGYTKATEDVFRSIPAEKINAAKEKLHIAYFHSSHGSRVITGMEGLKNYKAGDDTLYDFTTNGTPVAGKLDIFDDYRGGNDLSAKDTVEGNDRTQWYNETVTFLADEANSDINVLMWSWCNPGGHDHQKYIDDFEQLISDYPDITFVFMTGHPNGDGPSAVTNSAYHGHILIREHCEKNNRFLIDYWDIETHGMDGIYYPNANDNGVSDGTEFYKDWQTAHPGEYFENSCAHTDEDQELTCNRKAYTAWWVWTRIAEDM